MNCSILIFAVIFIIQIYIVRFTDKLIDNKKKYCNILENNLYIQKFIYYIKYYAILTMIIVGISFLSNILFGILNTNIDRYLHYIKFLYLIYFVAGLVAIYLLFYITKKIKNSNSRCSEMKENEILYYYSIFIINVYVMIVLGIIFSTMCFTNNKFL